MYYLRGPQCDKWANVVVVEMGGHDISPCRMVLVNTYSMCARVAWPELDILTFEK